MQRGLAAGLLFLTAIAGAHAGDSAPKADDSGSSAVAPTADAPPLRLASLVKDGDTPTRGDLVTIERPFGTWKLLCNVRISTNKRICSVEQAVVSDKALFVWRIGMTTTLKPVVIFAMPPNFDADTGLHLGFSGLEKTIRAKEWACNGQSCIAAFPFSGLSQTAIANSRELKFQYSLKVQQSSVVISTTSTMDGFSDALDAASKDPFGTFNPDPAPSPGKSITVASPKSKTAVSAKAASRSPSGHSETTGTAVEGKLY